MPRILLLCVLAILPVSAQVRYFAGAMGGSNTLKADGISHVSPEATSTSLYKPENGPAATVFGGAHLNNYISVQGSYTWDRNALQLTSIEHTADSDGYYRQQRSAVEQAVAADVNLYFRGLDSFARPYLSAGLAAVHLSSGAGRIESTEGPLAAPGGFSSTDLALRVTVGIDLKIRDGWALRYTFGETIRNNPISARMTPPPGRDLAQFQNLFGFVKTF